jgi:transposase
LQNQLWDAELIGDMNNRIQLTDRQWALIAPQLPPPAKTGRPRADDRAVVEAILHVLRTGCRWQDLPDGYGIAATTAWRRLRRWEEDGTWERLWRAVLAALDNEEKLRWAEAFLDGSFVPAKRGAPASVPPERVKAPN